MSDAKTPATRKFFEVFGDSVAENEFLRNLVVILTGCCLCLVLAVLFVERRPPLVIRVDNLGEPVFFTDAAANNAATPPEIKNFAKFYTQYLLGWDAYTFADDEKHVVEMSTPHAVQEINDALTAMHSRDYITTNKVRTQISLTDVIIDKDTPAAVRIIVRGTRTLHSYADPAFDRDISFEDTIIALKVARSQTTPWGLLVDDWSEKIFKGAL